MIVENTGQSRTSRTLVEIQNFFHQNNPEVLLFNKMYLVFTDSFPTISRALCRFCEYVVNRLCSPVGTYFTQYLTTTEEPFSLTLYKDIY